MTKRGQRTAPEIRTRITELARASYGPSEIARRVHEEYDDAAPGLRTIQTLVAEARKQPGSEPWHLYDSEPADLPLILPVLRAAIEWTEGRRQGLTQAEVARIVPIVRAAPDIPPVVAFRLALLSAPDPGLEEFLAYTPWQSSEAAERYVDAWEKQYFPAIKLGLVVAVQVGWERQRPNLFRGVEGTPVAAHHATYKEASDGQA